ncbi:MAG: sigma-54 dependent transcriptional regulator [Myxococcota bacterium]|nr:sigma-54 dependent transcriptional regulator [Myxococcota bacterium]MEC9440605.1 sigma-54 dependent transcriptional regulator [Myxococcota bacterium]
MSAETTSGILILCDPEAEAGPLSEAIEAHGWCLRVLDDPDELSDVLKGEEWLCAVVCDDASRTRLDGALRQSGELLPIIGAVRQGDVARSVLAMQLGAVTVLEIKPGNILPSSSSVLAAIDEFVRPLTGTDQYDPRDRIIRAPDSPINEVLDILPQLARSDAPVLITGESGTGKDLLARTIHELGPRAQGPFVAVNCGAIPHELLESELFGHVRGAFTGAIADQRGQFEAAHKGTIFLDEVAEMPSDVQVKLLRVLQEKQLTPLGSTTPIKVDFRVIAATNRDIESELDRNGFRDDLYYRLSVLPLHMPALRERPQDIPILAAHFIALQNEEHGTGLVDLTREVRTLFKRYVWPGNVRELENLIQRISIIKRSGFIEREDLPPQIVDASPQPLIGLDVPSEGIDMASTLDRLESRLLEGALKKASGNKAQAARLLGINRTTLVEKLKRKQISLDD